jgi:Fur family ferric uptake transcriptional regulator
MTNQRRVILEELKRLKTHPTADELYRIVRARLPKISLGTVYRNLEILSEAGLIGKLGAPDVQKRFDGNVENHYHLRCTRCGAVCDVVAVSPIDIRAVFSDLDDYRIDDYRLELIGQCPECVKKGVSSA